MSLFRATSRPLGSLLLQRHASGHAHSAFPVLPAAAAPYPCPDPQVLERSRSAVKAHEDLEQRCRAGGGPRGIKRHVETNKKVLVRERLSKIVDEVLMEVGTTAGVDLDYGDVPCAGVVAVFARICGVTCLVTASDGTVKGGTSYPITVTKSVRLQELGRQLRLPCLYLVDSGGAFLPMQSDIFPDAKHGGRSFRNQAVMSSEGIPQVALVNGLCTAGGAYTPTMADEAAIVHRIGNIYLGGPPLVKAATGEVVTGEELGGATMHCSVSGITDHFAQDEQESFEIVRAIFASLNIEEPEMFDGYEEPLQTDHLDYLGGLDRIDRDASYALLAAITDGSRFFEFKKKFGSGLIAGFARIRGRLAGILMNCGHLTAADGQKGAHFVQLCDGRDIPLIFLQNGFHDDAPLADAATLKERAKFVHAQSAVRVPKVTLNVGGVCGDELYTMCGPSFNPTFFLSWPRARLGKLPADLAQEAGDDERAPQYWAARSVVDAIVAPKDTRDTLSKCLHLSMLNHEKDRRLRGQQRSVLRM